MPFYQKGNVRIHYEEAGSGFPLFIIYGGGLNSKVSYANGPFDAMEVFKSEYRCISMDLVNRYLGKMYGGVDFVLTVTRDFVRACHTPLLVLPDNVPSHPYATAMEMVHLAPHAQVSLFPWKDTQENVKLAVRHIRTFPRANRPAVV